MMSLVYDIVTDICLFTIWHTVLFYMYTFSACIFFILTNKATRVRDKNRDINNKELTPLISGLLLKDVWNMTVWRMKGNTYLNATCYKHTLHVIFHYLKNVSIYS